MECKDCEHYKDELCDYPSTEGDGDCPYDRVCNVCGYEVVERKGRFYCVNLDCGEYEPIPEQEVNNGKMDI